MVLQEHLLEILLQFTRKLQINSDFEKWKTFLYVTRWISVTMKSLQIKYFIYKQAAWAQSRLKPFRRFHKMTLFGRSCMIMRPISKKMNVERRIFQFPVLQIEQDFPIHTLFSQFWRYPYENLYTRLKTGCVTANAGAIGITFCCLATVSQMTWIIWKCTVISVKVFYLFI